MAPVYLSDLATIRPNSVAESGFVIPRVGRALLGLAALNFATALAYRISTLSVASSDATPNLTTDNVWFFCLTLESALFMLYFAWNAVSSENVYTLAAFQACAFFLCARAVLEYFSYDAGASVSLCSSATAFGQVCVVSTVTQGVFTLLYLALYPVVYKSFGWRFYRQFGSDAMLHNMYKTYQQFLSLKFLDLSFSLLMLTTGVIYLAFTTYGSIVSALGLVFELVWMRLGTVAIMRENDNAMKWWLGLSVLGPLYVIFFWVVATSEGMAVDFQDGFDTGTGTGAKNATVAPLSPSPSLLLDEGLAPSGASIRNPMVGLADDLIVTKMIVLTILAMANRALSVLFGIRAWKNFGKGLMDRVFDRMGQGGGAGAKDSAQAGRDTNLEMGQAGGDHTSPQHGRGPSLFDDVGTVNVVNNQP
jgi:hypothetical protein